MKKEKEEDLVDYFYFVYDVKDKESIKRSLNHMRNGLYKDRESFWRSYSEFKSKAKQYRNEEIKDKYGNKEKMDIRIKRPKR